MGTITQGPDEIDGSGSDSDNISTKTASDQSISLNYGFDGTTWDRLRSDGNDSDGVSATSLGLLNSNNFGYAFDGFNWQRLRSISNSSDAISTGIVSLRTVSQNYNFNNTSFDRERGNTEETILASAARTANVNSADFTNFNAKGAHFIIDVSADPAAASITVTIQGKDSVSGNFYDILVSSAINSVGTTILKVFPGIAVVANLSASDILPRVFRVKVVTVDADSLTYSVSASLVV